MLEVVLYGGIEEEGARGHTKHDTSESELEDAGFLCEDVIYPQEP